MRQTNRTGKYFENAGCSMECLNQNASEDIDVDFMGKDSNEDFI